MCLLRLTKPAVITSALFLCVFQVQVRPQDAPVWNDSQPKVAGKLSAAAISFVDEDSTGIQDSTTRLQPDTQPITGIQSPTLGTHQILHSFWVPGAQYGNVISSSPLNQMTSSGLNSRSYVLGSLSALQTWTHAQFVANYSGGGYFSSDSSQQNGMIHEFGAMQTFEWQRWRFALVDQFSYLPETAFGFAVGTGISIPGIGGDLAPVVPNLQDSYQMNQSIFTSAGTRYSNTFTGQAVYAVSRRASISVSGSYGTLRFVEPGSINTDASTFRLGYNYSLSRKDTIGLLYRFSEFRYLNTPQTVSDHVVAVAYGRKITGQLSLQLYGGPEVTTFRAPLPGRNYPIGGLGGVTLSYTTGPNQWGFSYVHGVSSGSGVFAGATTDQLQASMGRYLSRYWHGDVNLGYARNKNLGNLSAVDNLMVSNYADVGFAVNRPVGHNSEVSLAYGAQVQASNQALCSVAACNESHVEHRITLGFSWHTAPFVLR